MRWNTAVARLIGALALIPMLWSATALAQDAKPFSNEQLDQMTAQVALYPDSLLSQLFMATTYPDEFAEAAKWSKAHPDSKGDEAVKLVESQPWDASVASLVAFPEVLITLGEKPDWVRNMGDAFLAQPEDVMNSVQRLRTQAQKAGNLKSNEQVKVSVEAAPAPTTTTTVVQQAAPPQVIVIQPAQPSVVYVPAYNPTTVYGPWAYPAYPPYYYPPPPGYWFSRTIATGIAWGVGIGVSNALWGGFDWGRHDVDINVNRYNNINVNKRIDVNSNRTTWNHNPEHRKTAYRGGDATRKNLDNKYQAGNREQFRGKDASRDASRDRASQAMQDRGVDAGSGSARDRAQTAERDQARQKAQNASGEGARAKAQDADRDAARQKAQNASGEGARAKAQDADRDAARQKAQNASGDGARAKAQGADRDAARQKAESADRDAARARAQSESRDNALKGANSTQARAQADRGATSQKVAQRPSGDGGGASAKRTGGGDGGRPSAGGGGAGRPSGGGDGGGRAGRKG